jgi:hypothetical protein
LLAVTAIAARVSKWDDAPGGEIALNLYKEAIFPQGARSKSSLVRYEIGAMKGANAAVLTPLARAAS